MTTPASTRRDAAPFAVFDCPLEGIRLVEASAGTGKTWTLCALVLRLLLERGLDVTQILVVTFTNAATAELRERVRQRLVETLDHLRGAAPAADDPFVPELLRRVRAQPGRDDAALAMRLELALARFDEAAIFTIHGFSQRALADAPFGAQMPLALELLEDDEALRLQAVRDAWRRRVADEALDPALAASLARHQDSPETIARLLRRRLGKPTARELWPQGIDHVGPGDAAAPLGALEAALAAARARWPHEREGAMAALQAAIPAELSGTTYKADTPAAAAADWDALLAAPDALDVLDLAPGKTALLGRERLVRATKKGRRTPQHPFFDAAQALLDAREALAATLALARARLLRELLDDAAKALHAEKRRRRVVAFDDMLGNLHARLTAADGARLAALLRARYPAALIDEFQDTDPLQFGIFQALYGAGGGTLFLVGDPKQAIYSFRNADLHTYLAARRVAAAEYTLAHNQRSVPALIDALNALFGRNPRAFMLPGLDYHPVAPGTRARAPLVDRSAGATAPLQVWTLPDDAGAGGPWPKAQARQAAADATAAEIARLLAAARRGEVTLGERALGAGDIAVLVRSHHEGRLVRRALAALGVGSVELSQASVFASAEAETLERVLAAALEPARTPRVKAALATEAMGWGAARLDALADDEAQLAEAVQHFAEARETWLQRGVGVMLRGWLATSGATQRLLAQPDGERRLTNLLHLIECLHQAAQVHRAPEALLRWLQAQRRDPRPDEATQLRLESDRHLVQVVTVHRAKGLEYGIVFCPFLWNGAAPRSDGLDGVEYHDDAGQAVVDWRAGVDPAFPDKEVKAGVRLEAAAESLRLIYVGLTRAVHRCVLVAGCYATGAHASAGESTRSALHWLAAGADTAPADWLDGRRTPAELAAAWAALAAHPHIALGPLPREPGTVLAPDTSGAERLAALDAPPRLPAGWWIGSYSALAHGLGHERAAADHDLAVTPTEGPMQGPTQGPADAPTEGPMPDDAPAPAPADDDILRFERGALAGECLHAVFEHADFTDPASWPAAIARGLRRLGPAAAPPGAGPDTLAARRLQRMLADVLASELPVGTATPLRLQDLPRARRLVELEFHLPVPRLESAALGALLARHGVALPAPAFRTLQGYLKGYIDLVLEHDGRWFVLDWKSNHLGDTAADYGPAPLAAAMAAQGYHLQALLYSVALERHLQHRLAGYAPERHFGGVLYLFVRGLRPHWRNTDGSPAGVHFQRPADALRRELSALLAQREVGP
ncbi:MAG TPA: exodeoxyribonuclease V subunit beta [Burkholderiaceae bacterium]|nr:exodeoxyribonuclease V subunit beta [Burkholderiaceae bacterium]